MHSGDQDSKLDEALEDSMAASDPPAFTTDGTAGAPVAKDSGDDLQIFKLEPVAERHDPRWQGQSRKTAIVRAQTAGDARVVAAEGETRDSAGEEGAAVGVSTRSASAFRDEKLYTVSAIPASSYRKDGQRQVIEMTRIDED